MNIITRLNNIRNKLASNVVIIAVSKQQSTSSIKTAYSIGHRDFGENYIQEMIKKYQKCPKDIRWHMIGKIQSNKLKYIVPFVHLIHSIDKFNQLKIIDQEAIKYQRIISCLLQIKIAQEDNKSGMTAQEAINILDSNSYANMNYVKIIGLMGMASFTKDEMQLSFEFKFLNMLFKKLQKKNSSIKILSMGMSLDYLLAISYGSTMIRIGRHIFK